MRAQSDILLAIIWDYDGTLVDSRLKNYSVTKKIITSVTGQPATAFSAMRDFEAYDRAIHRCTNWREFYMNEFGFSADETDQAGKKWTPTQLADETDVHLIPGLEQVFQQFGHIPHGIVSQNSRSNMSGLLDKIDLLKYFQSVIGYEEVDIRRQKPHPQGLLRCIEQVVTQQEGTILYIGDHETDARCARNTSEELIARQSGLQVLSVAADYLNQNGRQAWQTVPDFFTGSVEELVSCIEHIISGDQNDRSSTL